ncbi:MAG: NifU family protein [Deltaproteobacteria bacterium]|nr:NifU family protein [Deltaproteobacteria bacterium]
MGLLDSIGRMLGKKDRESEAVFPYQAGYKASDQPAAPAPAPAAPAAAPSAGSAAPAAFVSLGSMGLGAAEPPKRRQVVQAFATVTTLGAKVESEAPADPSAIRIKAEPQSSGDTCKFLVDRPVFAGRSWFFAGPGVTQGSPLAEKLFAIPELDSVLIDDSTLSVTRKTKDGDWKSLATQIGALIRAQLESSEPAVATSIAEKIPGETEIRDQIQRVIDLEVNPGVAAHSGHISLTAVRGNSVYIKMGGGCQGCSAADLTLKEGIHRSFRSAVPFVGAIYDETDHKAGLNPYFR